MVLQKHQSLGYAGRLTDNLNLGMGRQEGTQTLTDFRLVIHNQHAQHGIHQLNQSGDI